MSFHFIRPQEVIYFASEYFTISPKIGIGGGVGIPTSLVETRIEC